MPLQNSGLSEADAATIDELLADAVRRIGRHEVVAKSDIDAMLGLENLKDQMGCDDVACAAEIGGALGAQFLVAGRLAKLGDNVLLVLKLLDTTNSKVTNSIKYKAPNDPGKYDEVVTNAARSLFGLEVEPLSTAPTVAPNDQTVLTQARLFVQFGGGAGHLILPREGQRSQLAYGAALLGGYRSESGFAWGAGLRMNQAATTSYGEYTGRRVTSGQSDLPQEVLSVATTRVIPAVTRAFG